MNHDTLLIEIHTEELPPKSLLALSEAWRNQISERLKKAQLGFSTIEAYATPRRLAVKVNELAAAQAEQILERKGPARKDAFDEQGMPTAACLGFAVSCGVKPNQLSMIKTPQGEWMAYQSTVAGKTLAEILPTIVEQAALALPIPKRMRWGESEVQFIRPVHAVILLYGNEVIPATILGCETGRKTRGHRFLSSGWIEISHPQAYEAELRKHYVIADFHRRRESIVQQAKKLVQASWSKEAKLFIQSDAFLNEVTGLVEWPNALGGHFDQRFLALPSEVLISSMQDHQRYFPVMNRSGHLLPYFVTISNIQPQDPSRVIAGNERVLRARLSDATFFYEADQKTSLDSRLNLLSQIVFQEKLGTFLDKAERIVSWSGLLATVLQVDQALAARAILLAKTDLTTMMVGEFPELQGVMGAYYARHDAEDERVALALREQYFPRYAGDELPKTALGQLLAIADRLDHLVGAFAVKAIPSGDKDPFGLRRAALGVLRILIEKHIDLDLAALLQAALAAYPAPLSAQEVVLPVLSFMQDRLRGWYAEQGMSVDIFAAVSAVRFTNPFEVHQRVLAVHHFKQRPEAELLCATYKRVNQILSKQAPVSSSIEIDPSLFEHEAEQQLLAVLEAMEQQLQHYQAVHGYAEVLHKLTHLQQPIDYFFEHVMVMSNHQQQRMNRLLILHRVRALFLKVADISLLQVNLS